jgi:hypothetical protein
MKFPWLSGLCYVAALLVLILTLWYNVACFIVRWRQPELTSMQVFKRPIDVLLFRKIKL